MQELFNLFDSFGYDHFRQGSLTDANYPDSFFTFWNYDTPNLSFYDDESKRYSERVQVCFYTNNAALIYTHTNQDNEVVYGVMDQFIEAAKEAGFIVNGRAYDVSADKENYYGRLINLDIIHKEE